MNGLTLQEQERRAYISGDVGRAALLALAIDGDDDVAREAQWAREQVNEAGREAELLRDDLVAAEDRIAALESQLTDLRDRIAGLLL